MDDRASSTGLQRLLGSVDGGAIVLSNVVGAGIFLTPVIIAGRVPSAEAFLGLWLLGGALAVVGAMAYAELAAMRPEAGGEYVYIREAFGPLAGFLSGWTSLVAGFSGAIAAASVGFAIYLGRFVPWAAGTEALVRLPAGVGDLGLTLTPRSLTALGLIALFSLIHAVGLGPGRWTQQALAWLNVVTIVLLVGAGFLADPGGVGATETAAAAAADPAAAGAGDALVALVLVMFTYSGWNVAAVLWGERGTALFTPLILLALASSVSAMVLAGPRVYYAMGRDRRLPAAFARVGDRGVPTFSIVVQGAWSGLLVLTGGFEALLTYTGFAVVLFAGAGVASLFVLRWKSPDVKRPFRAWGYPVAPALFVLVSLAMVGQSVLRVPGPSLAGLGIIAAGVPVYLWMRRRGRTS